MDAPAQQLGRYSNSRRRARTAQIIHAFAAGPDTLPGADLFVVLAPEDIPMVDELTAAVWPEKSPAGSQYPEAGSQTPRGASALTGPGGAAQ